MVAVDMTAVLRGAPENAWIALSNDQDKIVGTGKTPAEAIQNAREHGEENPFVMKVPPTSALILARRVLLKIQGRLRLQQPLLRY